MKKRTLIIIISLISLISGSDIFSQNLDQGLKYVELNQVKHAKGFFYNFIKRSTLNSQLSILNSHAWLNLGDIYAAENNLDSANICYNKGIEANPEDGYNYIGVAKIEMKKTSPNYELITKNYIDKAIKLMRNAKDAKFYIYIGDAYFYNQNYDKAFFYLDKAKEINKTIPELYLERGDVFMAQSKAGEAANEYERALYFNKNYAKAYYEEGKLYVLAWNYDEALKNFQNVINIDSNYIPVYKELGELYYRANQNKKAAEAYAKYIAKAEIAPADIARYAQMLFFSNNYQKSSDVIDRYLKVDSNNFVLLRIKAYDNYELKNYNEGLKAMKKMLKLVNKDNKLITTDYEYNAKFLANDHKDSLAINYYILAIQHDSSKTYIYEDIAKCYENMNKYQKAVVYYQKLINAKKVKEINDYYVMGKDCYRIISDQTNPVDTATRRKFAAKADSAFDIIIKQLPDQHYGYIYKARVSAVLDPSTESGLAKPWYEKAVEIMEKTPDKFTTELIEANEYLGFYYFIKKEYNTSETFWKKNLTIDPNNAKAHEALEGIKKMRVKPKPKTQAQDQ